jgi:phage FluMu gp28-like protein
MRRTISISCAAGCADEESFQQEFCCVPSDDNSAFLSYDLIAGCEYSLTEVWEKDLRECNGADCLWAWTWAACMT